MLGTHKFLDDFAFLYHLAVAEKLRFTSEIVLAKAKSNLTRWKNSGNLTFGEIDSLTEWEEILEMPTEQIISQITEISDNLQRLRQSSPFVGVLTSQERLEILENCEKATAN